MSFLESIDFTIAILDCKIVCYVFTLLMDKFTQTPRIPSIGKGYSPTLACRAIWELFPTWMELNCYTLLLHLCHINPLWVKGV